MHPAFRIGDLPVVRRVLAAPMCGATKPAYRRMVSRFGADVVYTEMVKAEPLARDDPRTLALLTRAPGEENCGPQICGHDDAVLAAAAARLEALGFPLVDINMGCPVRKIVSQGAGAALLRDPRRVEAVVAACAAATRLPVTVKLRSGWDHQGHADVVDLVRAAEAGGAALITIHARVRAQRHTGEVDLAALARAKQAASVPVVANGGITSGAGARELLARTGCDAVMIGTGAHGRPWLFRDAARAIAGEPPLPPPGVDERCALVREHLEGTLAVMGAPGVRLFRKYAGWYFLDEEGAGELRARAYRTSEPEAMRALIEAWRELLRERGAAAE
ncbi:MAG: tRNA dihydrouridine synthase [Planctomycetota bacterium]